LVRTRSFGRWVSGWTYGVFRVLNSCS